VILHCNGWISGDVRNLDFATVFGGISMDGTLQEYIVVEDGWVIERPEGVSAVEGAALVYVYECSQGLRAFGNFK
jgi:NADPH:quinone reductase-like Zn-dependent oxidoreductase